MNSHGALDKDYHHGRKSKKALIYRLNRRTKEVIQAIQKHFPGQPSAIVDLGTADGLMLSKIKDHFPSAQCVGLEYSRELVETITDNRIMILQGDVNFLPIPNNSFDIVVATAIIEHLPNPKFMLQEVKRVLKSRGLIIVTSPDPFWERMATILGHLSDEGHCNVMNLDSLSVLFNEVGFAILEKKKFMLSPIGMPLEIHVENKLRKIGLNFLFANQVLIGKKINS